MKKSCYEIIDNSFQKIAKLTDDETEEFEELSKKVQKEDMEHTRGLLKEVPKDMGAVYGGTAGILGGAKSLEYVNNKGLIDGRRKLYHNTDNKNVESILKQGLKGSKTNDPNSYTRKVMSSIGIDDYSPFENKVYAGKTKKAAKGAATGRYLNEHPFEYMFSKDHGMKNAGKWMKKNTKTLNVNIPIDEYEKLNKVRNPELEGAKNLKEFISKKKKKVASSAPELAAQYFTLGKNTATIDGDIASKFIKGGEGYKKNSAKQILKYVKANPGKAAKGAGIGALGAAAMGGGAYLIGKNELNNLKKRKEYKEKIKNDADRKRFTELGKKYWQL